MPETKGCEDIIPEDKLEGLLEEREKDK